MSIKCSLLGHSFDETSVERDRQEDGSEVVITITELETCSRCDETRVVSENKEVTTLETPDDPDSAEGTDAEAESATERGADDAAADYDPDGDDAEILDADGAEADAQADARGTASIPDAESDDATADDATADDPPEEDDAVILDGDSGGPATADDSPAPDHGRPGDTSDPSSSEDEIGASESGGDDGSAAPESSAGQWPDDDAAADAADAGAVSEPAMDGETGGDWPEEPADSGPQQEPMDEWPEATRRDDRGAVDGSGPDLEESASPTVTVPEGMFKCSQCGFETAVDSSSLRAGDFCPECHQGTLMQREDEEVDA